MSSKHIELTSTPSLIDEAALTFITSLYTMAAQAAEAVMVKLMPIVTERTAARITAA